MNDEFERIWKEEIVALLKAVTRKNHIIGYYYFYYHCYHYRHHLTLVETAVKIQMEIIFFSLSSITS